MRALLAGAIVCAGCIDIKPLPAAEDQGVSIDMSGAGGAGGSMDMSGAGGVGGMGGRPDVGNAGGAGGEGEPDANMTPDAEMAPDADVGPDADMSPAVDEAGVDEGVPWECPIDQVLGPHVVCEGQEDFPCNGCEVGTVVPAGWSCLPSGHFQMGTDTPDCDRPEPSEACRWAPSHRVEITQFLMKISEITNAEYAECVADGACEPPHTDDTCNVRNGGRNLPLTFQEPQQPVVCVDFFQAQAFARWTACRIPDTRLPTEAEWEYAARGASRQSYPWGFATPTCDQAVMSRTAAGQSCNNVVTAPVCQNAGNSPQGICNLGGNVHEWTLDCYHPSYEGAPADGSAWLEGCDDPTFRVTRGGAWNAGANNTPATYRYARNEPNLDGDYGIRLVAPALIGPSD